MVEVIEVTQPTQPVIDVIAGQIGFTELGYVTGSTDVAVASGQTVTVLQTTIVITTQTQLRVMCAVPSLEFTNNNGGHCVPELVAGATVYSLADLSTDRAFSWPVGMSRKVPVSPGSVQFTFRVRSVLNPCTAHAGPNYGETSMRIIG
jgi:hypothetical protein